MPPTQIVRQQITNTSAQEVTQESLRQATIKRQSFEGQQISKSCVQELQKKLESQESGSSSLEKSAMLEESQSAMSLQNIASETSSTMQETMAMTSMQETKVTQEMHQEMHQEVHQKVHQEMHREMLLSEEVEEM